MVYFAMEKPSRVYQLIPLESHAKEKEIMFELERSSRLKISPTYYLVIFGSKLWGKSCSLIYLPSLYVPAENR